MKLRPYEPHLYPTLCRLLELHDHPLPASLPKIGCAVFEGAIPVAFCFLRQVEGGYGMIDGLTSNPKCSSKNRHEALDMAILHCVDMAKSAGIRHLVSFALNETTTMRAERLGFVKQPHSMVTLSIKESL